MFKRVAEGYSNYRPHYHSLIMQKIKHQIKLESKIKNALDIGCGSGLSTKALKEIAKQVTGTDNSLEMISVAKANNIDDIKYLHVSAEQLPFNENTFDIITVAGSINWIDRTRFLPEAQRVLRKGGWLIIYDNFITDQMIGNLNYTHWHNEQYLSKFPKPSRNENPISNDECSKFKFKLMNSEEYSNKFDLSCEEYVEFMLTQSNVIVSVDMGTEKLSSARKWMQSTLNPIFQKTKETFIFSGYIWYLQLQDKFI